MIDKLFVYLFSDVGQKIIKTNKRSYGDSLDKFEPGDLNESLCPNQMQLGMMSDKDAAEALRLADNDEEAALALSNQLIKKIMNR
jgi:adenine-specific DNA-methyltransferase